MPFRIKSLFLENIGFKQTILKNTFWLSLAELIARLTGLVLAIYMARILGASGYGQFTFAFSFVSLVAIFLDLGIIDTSIREFSRSRENERKISEIFTLEIFLCIATLFIATVASFFITGSPLIRKTIFILTFFIISNSLMGIIFALLRARQRMEYESVIRIFQALLSLVLVLLVLFIVPSVVNLSYAYLISNLLVLVIILALFHFYFQPIKIIWNKNIFLILKKSWPLSFGFIAAWLYVYIDSVMLGSFNLIAENGWYSAASKIAIAAMIPASLIIRSFYPALSSFFVSSREELQKSWDYLAESMIFLAVPMAVGGVMLAPKIIGIFYGPSFFPSIFALQLLIFVTGISFITFPYSTALVVADQQKKNFYSIFIGGILNIVLNFILIPKYSLYGAVISTIVSLVAVFIMTFAFTKKLTPIAVLNKRLFGVVIISVISTFAMYLLIRFLSVYSINVFIIIISAASAYFLAFSLLASLQKISSDTF